MSQRTNVAIIGGGISGLSAAWYLQKSDPSLHYTVLEGGEVWGGKIQTDQMDGFTIEGGADAFITQKPWGLQLARDLGLEDELLGTNDHMRKVFVLNNGKPTPLPDGVMLIVPTKFMPFVLSPLISLRGKLRMGMELFIRPKRDGQDETLADFIKRRLGAEALDKIAEPLMAGIYNAEAEYQSLLATFPRFRTLEEKYGSITRGMLAGKRHAAQNGASSAKKPPMFITLKNGTHRLIEALAEQLTGDLCLDSGVKTIERLEDGGFNIKLANGDPLQADAVVITTPAYVAAKMLQNIAPNAAETLDTIRYVSTGTISIAYRRSEIQHPLNGFGIVIPRSENRQINAITWSSTKFDHRAPDDQVLLRIFFGGSRTPQTFALDDDELLSVVCKELREIMGIDAEPTLHRIFRWHNANPQYDLGHLERVDEIESALPSGVFVTGSPYRGVGIPDCVYQSQQTVEKLLNTLIIKETEPV